MTEPAQPPDARPVMVVLFASAAAVALALLSGCRSMLPWLELLDDNTRPSPSDWISLLPSATAVFAGIVALVTGFRYRRRANAYRGLVLTGQILGGLAALYVLAIWAFVWYFGIMHIPMFPSP